MSKATKYNRRMIMLAPTPEWRDDGDDRQDLARRVEQLESRLEEKAAPAPVSGNNGAGVQQAPAKPTALRRVLEAAEDQLSQIAD